MSITLFIAIVCAIFFFRAATYERLIPWAWMAASFGLALMSHNLAMLLLTQAGLFALMWWYNFWRQQRKRD